MPENRTASIAPGSPAAPSVADIARQAAELIRSCGLDKQSWGSKDSGFCILGAVRAVLLDQQGPLPKNSILLRFQDPKGKNLQAISLDHLERFKQCLVAIWNAIPEPERAKAQWPDESPLFAFDRVRPICRWNDAKDRTMQEILAVLDTIASKKPELDPAR